MTYRTSASTLPVLARTILILTVGCAPVSPVVLVTVIAIGLPVVPAPLALVIRTLIAGVSTLRLLTRHLRSHMGYETAEGALVPRWGSGITEGGIRPRSVPMGLVLMMVIAPLGIAVMGLIIAILTGVSGPGLRLAIIITLALGVGALIMTTLIGLVLITLVSSMCVVEMSLITAILTVVPGPAFTSMNRSRNKSPKQEHPRRRWTRAVRGASAQHQG